MTKIILEEFAKINNTKVAHLPAQISYQCLDGLDAEELEVVW